VSAIEITQAMQAAYWFAGRMLAAVHPSRGRSGLMNGPTSQGTPRGISKHTQEKRA
jgi:hypothetical protein